MIERKAGKANRQPHPQRPRGRPVSALVDRALVKAAVDEFTERGYRTMTMESIAKRARVSKVSLYRRWSSKLAVTEEVFRVLGERKPAVNRGSLEADIRFLVNQSIASRGTRAAAKLIMRTMGEISDSPVLLASYRRHLLAPRMEQLRALLNRARARRELRSDLPIDLACTLVAGPLFLYYLTILTRARTNLPGDLAAQFTRAILQGIGSGRL